MKTPSYFSFTVNMFFLKCAWRTSLNGRSFHYHAQFNYTLKKLKWNCVYFKKRLTFSPIIVRCLINCFLSCLTTSLTLIQYLLTQYLMMRVAIALNLTIQSRILLLPGDYNNSHFKAACVQLSVLLDGSSVNHVMQKPCIDRMNGRK